MQEANNMERVKFELPVDTGNFNLELKEFEADFASTETGFVPEEAEANEILALDTETAWGENTALESGRTSREFVIARVSGVPQFKTEMERQCRGGGWTRICIRVPVLYRRTAKYTLKVRLSTGKVTNDDIWNAVKNCVLTAAATAGAAGAVAAYASGGSAGLAAVKAAFVPALKACLLTKAEEIKAIASDVRVDFRLDSTSGRWRRSS